MTTGAFLVWGDWADAQTPVLLGWDIAWQ